MPDDRTEKGAADFDEEFFKDDGPTREDQRRERSPDDPESVVRRYYALFENLVVMLLDWRNWSRSLRSFLKTEARYRGKLLLAAFGLFVAGLTCIVISIWLLALGSYQLLSWALGSPMAASFALFIGFLLLAVFLFAILLKTGGKLLEQRESEDDLYNDDENY